MILRPFGKLLHPEDITRAVLSVGKSDGIRFTNGAVPSSKFIVQQVPADQMDHYKINCMSNEEGRSDLSQRLGL